MMKRVLVLAGVLLALVASAIEIPKASGKALGVTKGKPCAEGLVFINGKYIEPPYVVERWGNGIRINKKPVIGQVIDWTEFLKTQTGVKVTKTENVAAPEDVMDEPEEEEEELDDFDDEDTDSSLDDLFDDDPKPKKAVKKPAKKKKVAKKRPPKPVTTVSYQLEGDFVANDASKALVQRVNKLRTDIHTTLLNDGVWFFGDGYARVSGDSKATEQVLLNLPTIQKKSTSDVELSALAREAGLVYLTRPICDDLYANRVDYIKLQRRRDNWKKDQEFKRMLRGSGRSSLL